MRSPGLELNDIGYMRYSDKIHHGTWLGYYILEPFSIFNNFRLNTNYWLEWNYSGQLLSRNINLNFNSQFKNRWRINGSASRNSKYISPTKLRGGSSFKNPGSSNFNVNINSDWSRKVSFYLGNYHSYGDNQSSFYHEYWTGITIRPSNSLSISINPSFSVHNSKLQYIDTYEMNTENRYVFGELDQKTLNLTFRVNFSLTPELTIQYYGQPFVSSGKYGSFKMITDPNAVNFEDRYLTYIPEQVSYDIDEDRFDIDEDLNGTSDYNISNPNFNFRQFRSNLVLRWEYSPGSTIYLVWSQSRSSSSSDGVFSYNNDIRDLFDTYPHNVFLVKLNYWFSL